MLIHKRALQAALHATNANESRGFAQSVYCTPTDIRATDGMLAIKIVAPAAGFPVTDFPTVAAAGTLTPIPDTHAIAIGVPMVRRLIQGMPKRETIPILHCVQVGMSESAPLAVSTDLEVPTVVALSPEPFPLPDIDRCWPAADVPTVRVVLSAAMLDRLAKMARALSDHPKGVHAVSIYVPTDDASMHKDERTVAVALRIRMNARDLTVDGVIMPCRD